MRRAIIIVCAAAWAASAYAEVGSLISSFYIGKTKEPTSCFRGIYRDPSYVYAMFWYAREIWIFTYTPSGVEVRTKQVYACYEEDYLGPATGTHLGAPYIAFSAAVLPPMWRIYIANVNTGSVAQSFPVGGSDIMWDGQYYSVQVRNGVYKRYTPAGAEAGEWAVAGWPAGLSGYGSAFSRRFNYAAGRYLFVATFHAGSHFVFNMEDGSLLASWPKIPILGYGQSYGDAYPRSYGGALWSHGYVYEGDAHWAYQIDINARCGGAVLPASLGKVKALYR